MADIGADRAKKAAMPSVTQSAKGGVLKTNRKAANCSPPAKTGRAIKSGGKKMLAAAFMAKTGLRKEAATLCESGPSAVSGPSRAGQIAEAVTTFLGRRVVQQTIVEEQAGQSL